ncbi:hypothetical protein FZ025_09965 [Xanthomonas hyacinthi]|nr:hypothetical protein [Xanthomonas hyacinthi]QGY76954.1 hypothetical protein FZ025_09965 [Xanthomonas hyacinthi]
MADLPRHPPSPSTVAYPAPLARDTPADASGSTEARAWCRQLRAALPRWLLAVLSLLGLGAAQPLFWYARA